jgi:Tfp pilus assembly protein PilO
MRDYYALCVLALFAFSLVGAIGFLKPMVDDIKAVRALTQSALVDAEAERGYLATLDRSVAAAQAIPPAALERVAAALPPAADAPSLLVQLHAAAQRSGVKIMSLSVVEPRPAAGGAAAKEPRPVDISLGIGARNYLDVKRLLAELEANIRIMDVQGLNTAGFQPGEEAMFSLQLRAYTYPSPEKKP